MGRKPFAIAGSLNDYLVAGVGQPVEVTVTQDGVVEYIEPFLHSPVGGDDGTGDQVEADYELVEVSGLLGCKAVKAQVIEDEQVWG